MDCLMPIQPDPHADADYGPLVEALAREGLKRRTDAVRAVEAVACALARRLAGADYEDLRELLPQPFRGRLVACERHARAGAIPRGDLRAYYGAIGEDLERRPDDVEPMARAVFSAIRAQAGERASEEIGRLLPEELQPLWRRVS